MDDGAVLYDLTASKTHVLDFCAYSVLRSLDSRPGSVREITSMIASWMDDRTLEDDPEFEERVRDILRGFVTIDVAEPFAR